MVMWSFMQKSDQNFLTGQLLVAMPTMGDNRFERAVILVCAHDEKGAMGLVINSEMDNIDFTQLLDQLELDIEPRINLTSLPVMQGGPVEQARGFLLHSKDYEQTDTISVEQDYKVTGSVDALKEALEGEGPEKMRFILGYSGWGPGQLDEEMQANAWLTIDPDDELIFQTEPEKIWEKAIQKIGIDPSMLSVTAGRA